ncbi:MAG: deacetylase [Planctomycetes bacterium]|nr:deacetylase [Planctomycetota bacterium]
MITIDTEGDNLWGGPRTITTRNADFLPRFQSLCELYELKPTYLVNYEMATCPAFQAFGRDIIARKTGEIGMHLHAWNSPPLNPLTKDDIAFQPYLIEYPESVMRKKITIMTDLLEDIFGVKMISHRAGRWSFNETYARILIEKGYHVDCSVTPRISWEHSLGNPEQYGGTDYSEFPDEAYFIDLENIARSGDSMLLEIPMTIVSTENHLIGGLRSAFKDSSLAHRALNRFFPAVQWFRPNGKNRNELMHIVQQAIQSRRSYLEFMLHSSELMPGGSPTFPGDKDIEVLYTDLDALFAYIRSTFVGATLSDYYESVKINKCRITASVPTRDQQ